MKELKIISIINPKEENNNENYENNEINNYKYLNSIDALIEEENKENNINFNDIIKVKDFTYYKNSIISFFKSFTIFVLVYLFYILSLEGCYEGEDECSIKMKWIYQKVIEVIISSIFFVIADN